MRGVSVGSVRMRGVSVGSVRVRGVGMRGVGMRGGRDEEGSVWGVSG